MAGGVQAGRLSIEIVAEIARLQTDLDKAKRAVKAMSSDIARDTKAANDNITRMGTGFARTGQVVATSAGAQRAAMTQLSFQLGDVAQGFAMGTRPMTIFAQQSGQVIQALSLMTNSTKGFLGFMAGPWGMVISAAAVVLVPLISKLMETEEAVKAVEFSSYKLGDAQGILGNVMNMTTGKINTQREALIALARAQILAGQIQARSDMASARSAIGGMAAPGFNIRGVNGGLLLSTGAKRPEAGILDAFREGNMNTDEAVRGLDSMRKTGMLTEKAFLAAAKAVTDFGVASENLKVFQGAERMLNGKGTGADRRDFLDPAKAKREKKGPKEKSAEDIQRRFEEQLAGYTQQAIGAMQQLATTAEERAELELRTIEWTRLEQVARINADKDFNAAQKTELKAIVERLAGYQRDIVEFRKQQQLEQEARQVEDARHHAVVDSLQAQAALADTEAARKDLALQIFDAETEYLRAKLEAVEASQTSSALEKQLAQIQLDSINATAGQRRSAVGQANATSVERYLRDLNASTEQLNEQFDQITIKGLDALGDSILDVVTGVKSLGDAFHDVSQQIISDLLQIAIRQMIVKPLANALFGGGGPVNLLAGIPGYANGTSYAPGGWSTVGENGPERMYVPQGASITPAYQSSRIANDNGEVHFHFPNVTNAREAREAGAQAARRYRMAMNGPVR